MLALDIIELVEITTRNGEWQNSNGHDFHFFADRVDLRHFFRREVAHDRAAIWNSLDDPFFLEFEERKSDVGAMRVELLTEILLDQPLARMAPAKNDVLF